MPKQSNLRQTETYKNIILFTLHCPSIAVHGACPQVWFLYPVRLHWRELIFPFTAFVNWR